MPSVITKNTAPTEPTVYAVGLKETQLLAVSVAVSKLGLGFRSYTTVSMAKRDLPKNPTGCVFLPIGPRDSAEELLAELRPAPSLSVIAITANESIEVVTSLVRSGIHSVVTPPFVNENLASSIRSAVSESHYRSSVVDGAADATRRMNNATAKELEVLDLIISGHKNKEIATTLGITIRAVEDRRGRLMRKVGVESVAELVVLAVTSRFFEQGFCNPGRPLNSYADPAIAAGTSSEATTADRNHGSDRDRKGPTESCLRGIEIWGKSDTTQDLTLLQSTYSDSETFGRATEGVTFYRGEGLPGMVWNQRAPVFLHELDQPTFVRSSAAREARIDAALGIPIFRRQHVAEVLVLLLQNRSDTTSAFEAWRVDPQTERLQLAHSHYINCPNLEQISPYLQFPIGKGLPGATADSSRPRIRTLPNDAAEIARAPAVVADGINSAIALPLTDSGSVFCDVFIAMNGKHSPLFSFLQTWKLAGHGLQLMNETVNGETTAETLTEQFTARPGTLAHKCWEQGSALVVGAGSPISVDSVGTAEITSAVAIPTFIQNTVVAVTVLGQLQNSPG